MCAPSAKKAGDEEAEKALPGFPLSVNIKPPALRLTDGHRTGIFDYAHD
jgi:hypothetical protein